MTPVDKKSNGITSKSCISQKRGKAIEIRWVPQEIAQRPITLTLIAPSPNGVVVIAPTQKQNTSGGPTKESFSESKRLGIRLSHQRILETMVLKFYVVCGLLMFKSYIQSIHKMDQKMFYKSIGSFPTQTRICTFLTPPPHLQIILLCIQSYLIKYQAFLLN